MSNGNVLDFVPVNTSTTYYIPVDYNNSLMNETLTYDTFGLNPKVSESSHMLLTELIYRIAGYFIIPDGEVFYQLRNFSITLCKYATKVEFDTCENLIEYSYYYKVTRL